jgi:hypothetical protein
LEKKLTVKSMTMKTGSVLQANMMDELKWDIKVNSSETGIDARKDIVSLSGKDEKKAVWCTTGVVAVENELVIAP